MTLMMVVLLLVATVTGATAFSTYRHRQLVAWDRELQAAFAPGERRDVPRHRAL